MCIVIDSHVSLAQPGLMETGEVIKPALLLDKDPPKANQSDVIAVVWS